jgi:CheY-like chemotaxis protein
LTEEGYRVLCASTGSEALLILSEETVDLVLSDVIMPKMNGYQLAAQILEKYPTMKIQLVSGYTDDKNLGIADQRLHQNLLNKPYSSNELLNSLRLLLNT